MNGPKRDISSKETDMSSTASEFNIQVAIPGRQLPNPSKDFRRKKRVILGAQEEGRYRNLLDETDGARPGVIVTRSSEAMDRAGNGIVKVLDRPRRQSALATEQARVLSELQNRLSPEALQKM